MKIKAFGPQIKCYLKGNTSVRSASFLRSRQHNRFWKQNPWEWCKAEEILFSICENGDTPKIKSHVPHETATLLTFSGYSIKPMDRGGDGEGVGGSERMLLVLDVKSCVVSWWFSRWFSREGVNLQDNTKQPFTNFCQGTTTAARQRYQQRRQSAKVFRFLQPLLRQLRCYAPWWRQHATLQHSRVPEAGDPATQWPSLCDRWRRGASAEQCRLRLS